MSNADEMCRLIRQHADDLNGKATGQVVLDFSPGQMQISLRRKLGWVKRSSIDRKSNSVDNLNR